MLYTHALLLPALPMFASTALAFALLPTYAGLYAGLWWERGEANWLLARSCLSRFLLSG